jgi:hypothetical protein
MSFVSWFIEARCDELLLVTRGRTQDDDTILKGMQSIGASVVAHSLESIKHRDAST